MLGQHPEMYGFPELNLFESNTVDDLLRLESLSSRHVNVATHTSGLLHALVELSGGSHSIGDFSRAVEWLHERRTWTTRQVFDYLLLRISPRWGIDKSPRTALSSRSLRRALEMYPNTRFVHLTRHPVTSALSLSRVRFLVAGSRSELTDDSDFFSYAVELWCFSHSAILSSLERLSTRQTLRVRAEELLGNPDDELSILTKWLEIASHTGAIEAMKHPERWPFATPPRSPLSAEGDPYFLNSPRLRAVVSPSSLEFPAVWRLSQRLKSRAQELARELGYF